MQLCKLEAKIEKEDDLGKKFSTDFFTIFFVQLWRLEGKIEKEDDLLKKTKFTLRLLLEQQESLKEEFVLNFLSGSKRKRN